MKLSQTADNCCLSFFLGSQLSLLASNEVVYKKPFHFVSGFHDMKKQMSSDKALDSYKEKSIHWNPNLTKCTGIGKSPPY